MTTGQRLGKSSAQPLGQHVDGIEVAQRDYDDELLIPQRPRVLSVLRFVSKCLAVSTKILSSVGWP